MIVSAFKNFYKLLDRNPRTKVHFEKFRSNTNVQKVARFSASKSWNSWYLLELTTMLRTVNIFYGDARSRAIAINRSLLRFFEIFSGSRRNPDRSNVWPVWFIAAMNVPRVPLLLSLCAKKRTADNTQNRNKYGSFLPDPPRPGTIVQAWRTDGRSRIRCARLWSDFLGDNLPYNYRASDVLKLRLRSLRAAVYSRDNILRLEFIKL